MTVMLRFDGVLIPSDARFWLERDILLPDMIPRLTRVCFHLWFILASIATQVQRQLGLSRADTDLLPIRAM